MTGEEFTAKAEAMLMALISLADSQAPTGDGWDRECLHQFASDLERVSSRFF